MSVLTPGNLFIVYAKYSGVSIGGVGTSSGTPGANPGTGAGTGVSSQSILVFHGDDGEEGMMGPPGITPRVPVKEFPVIFIDEPATDSEGN